MALNKTDLDLINSHLQGTLDTASKALFSKRMSDADFKKEVAFQRHLKKVLLNKEKEKIVASLHAAFPDTATQTIEENGANIRQLDPWYKRIPRIPLWQPLSVAATVALLIFAIPSIRSLVFQETIKPIVAFKHYFQPYDASLIIPLNAGMDIDSLNQAIANSYQEEQYLEAINSIDILPDKNKQSGILLIKANALLELEETDKAINILVDITNKKELDSITQRAKWYLALAYLQKNNNAEAKSILTEISTDSSNIYKKEIAQELLEKLE